MRHVIDGRTDLWGATVNAAPREGCTFDHVPKSERKVCEVCDSLIDRHKLSPKTKHFRW